jgi:hypothetical protein
MLLLLLLATTQWSHMQRAARCVSIRQRSDFEHPREPLRILSKQVQNNNSNQKAQPLGVMYMAYGCMLL